MNEIIARWRIWQISLQARILKAFFAMVLSLAITVAIATYVTQQQALDLLRVQLSDTGSLALSISPWMFAVFGSWVFVIWWFVWPRETVWEAKEITIDVAKIGSIKLTPNQEVAGLAHRAWTEIVTRKACLPFDDNDVITEVYDSWYALFGEIRTMIKSIPVEKLRTSKDAQMLCDHLTAVLNEVLRPHLTRYQARYRAWFEHECEANPGEAPQDIQKRYSDYDELVKDLMTTIADFTDFKTALLVIARGKESDAKA